MNYQFVKSIIDSIVQNFVCQQCFWKVQDSHLELVSAVGTSIHMNVVCPHCGKSSVVKAEINSIDLWNIAPDGSNLSEVKQKLWEKLSQMQHHQGETTSPKINEKEITDVRKKLKYENISVSELFEN